VGTQFLHLPVKLSGEARISGWEVDIGEKAKGGVNCWCLGEPEERTSGPTTTMNQNSRRDKWPAKEKW